MANPNNEAGVDRLVADARARDKSNQSVIDEFRANGGKVGGDLEGVPVLLLTMTGAKTGRTLIRPLCYSRDGDRLVIVASYGGAPHNPPWYYNLLANPVVTVEVGVEKFKARAAETDPKTLLYMAEAVKRWEVANTYFAKNCDSRMGNKVILQWRRAS